MKQLVLALTIFAAIHTNAVAAPMESNEQVGTAASSGKSDGPPKRVCRKWKDDQRFAISNIFGLQDSYPAGEAIVFHVEGTSPGVYVKQENGFYVSASLSNASDNRGSAATVTYDEVNGGWSARFEAPKDPKEYTITIKLLCSSKQSPCADAFGADTWVDQEKKVLVQ